MNEICSFLLVGWTDARNVTINEQKVNENPRLNLVPAGDFDPMKGDQCHDAFLNRGVFDQTHVFPVFCRKEPFLQISPLIIITEGFHTSRFQ